MRRHRGDCKSVTGGHHESYRESIGAAGKGMVQFMRIDLTPSRDTRKEQEQEQDRERTRRTLIYADQVAVLGRIDYDRVMTWAYQPSEQEVDEVLELAAIKRKETNVPKRRSA